MNAGTLFLEQWGASIRWHRTRPGGEITNNKPLVCLPALSMPSKESFADTVTDPALKKTDALLIDYLGSGTSDHPKAFPWTLEAHADAVAAVMDHLGCGPCPVFGHSMGGSVAIALALRRPDLVSQLIIAEGNLTPGGGAVTRRIAAIPQAEFLQTGIQTLLASLNAAGTEGNVFVSFAAKAWAIASPAGLHGNALALVGLPDDFATRFLALNIPRTFVYGALTYPGTTGKITPDQPDPDLLRAHGITIEIVPEVGHALQLANPIAVAQIIASTLEQA